MCEINWPDTQLREDPSTTTGHRNDHEDHGLKTNQRNMNSIIVNVYFEHKIIYINPTDFITLNNF